MRLWTRLLDEKIHPVTGTVTFAIGPRTLLLQLPAEVREARLEAIPNPASRAIRRSVIENGVGAPEFPGALAQMLGLLESMDAALSSRQWLAADGFTLADAGALPYVERLDALAMTPLIDARPNVSRWYERVKALPAYEAAVTRWTPAFISDLFRTNGEAVWKDVEPMTRAKPPG